MSRRRNHFPEIPVERVGNCFINPDNGQIFGVQNTINIGNYGIATSQRVVGLGSVGRGINLVNIVDRGLVDEINRGRCNVSFVNVRNQPVCCDTCGSWNHTECRPRAIVCCTSCGDRTHLAICCPVTVKKCNHYDHDERTCPDNPLNKCCHCGVIDFSHNRNTCRYKTEICCKLCNSDDSYHDEANCPAKIYGLNDRRCCYCNTRCMTNHICNKNPDYVCTECGMIDKGHSDDTRRTGRCNILYCKIEENRLGKKCRVVYQGKRRIRAELC